MIALNFLFNIIFFLFRIGVSKKLASPVVLNNVYVSPYSGLVADSFFRIYGYSAHFKSKITKLRYYMYKSHFGIIDWAAAIGHGPWDNYYHWYIDSVPRIWGFYSTTLNLDTTIQLLISRELSIEEQRLIECLLPHNVKILKVGKFDAFRARRFFFLPFYSGNCSGKLPKDYLTFYLNRVIQEFSVAEAPKQLRVFISRKKCGRRYFSNHVEVEDFLVNEGFLILELETLSLPEQIYCFYNAEVVIGSHGAGLTNLLYARVCTVLEIFHCPNNNLNHYRDLAEAKGLAYTSVYLDGKHKDDPVVCPVTVLQEFLNTSAHASS